MTLAVMVVSCGRKPGNNAGSEAAKAVASKEFPQVEIPMMLDDNTERVDYYITHFWDAYLDTAFTGLCDSSHVKGVSSYDLEGKFGEYSTILWQTDLETATNSVASMFKMAEANQRADTSSNVLENFTFLADKYLYNPNSPVRNEDLYYPFVEGLSKSEFTDPGLREAYAYDARMCSLNRTGTPAANFKFTDSKGHIRDLYSIKADYLLLFFVNPGCSACREIIDEITADPDISSMTESGELAVVDIYIDDEIDKWKEYVPNYPESWISGYDHLYKIRTNVLYNVRAIPSIYLLDKDKKVLFKDSSESIIFGFLRRTAAS